MTSSKRENDESEEEEENHDKTDDHDEGEESTMDKINAKVADGMDSIKEGLGIVQN